MIGEGEAYSLICNGMPESNKFKNFEKLSINTLALNSTDLNSLHDNYFDNYAINNIIFKDSILWESLNSDKIFSKIIVKELQVITFTNTQLSQNNIYFDWRLFKSFTNLRAIYIENGVLGKLDSNFGSIPANTIITATFDNIKLELIEDNVFENWKNLKMLSITNNLIIDLNWIKSDFPELWLLDLRYNKLKTIPNNLIKWFPKLRVLKLAYNEIRTVSYEAIQPLLTLKEFSFEGILNFFQIFFTFEKLI